MGQNYSKLTKVKVTTDFLKEKIQTCKEEKFEQFSISKDIIEILKQY